MPNIRFDDDEENIVFDIDELMEYDDDDEDDQRDYGDDWEDDR